MSKAKGDLPAVMEYVVFEDYKVGYIDKPNTLWFSGTDVARAMGFHVHNVMRYAGEDERLTESVIIENVPCNILFISTTGIGKAAEKLIRGLQTGKADKPIAERLRRFADWAEVPDRDVYDEREAAEAPMSGQYVSAASAQR
jgi:prophage antirepressor-like protein